ncbi:MAG: response regulator [Thermodesulfobacteriota bacterium]|nr:response regulator [Thermodesulfobacteriota bacterium]
MNNNVILLVDDEKNIINSISRLLIEKNFYMLTAQNGMEALELIKHNNVDIVISDQRMPGMTGLELMGRIKKKNPSIIRVLLTAYSDKDVMLKAINQGEVYRFLIKPWDENELLETIKQGLKKRNDRFQEINSVQYQLSRSNIDTVMALAEAIELKDPYTKGHCSRVKGYSLAMARLINLPKDLFRDLMYGSLLHDCGKIGIKEEILLSNGSLSEKDKAIMQQHSVLGFKITNKIENLKKASLFIRQHHERWDGKGYPDSLAGEKTHICSRILSIADSFDAMTSDRPYRKGMGTEKAKQILVKEKGGQFDPYLVDIFIKYLEEKASGAATSMPDSDFKYHQSNILIVDDERLVIQALSRMLFGENYYILSAANGHDALEVIKNNNVDLVISDQKMPGMSGLEFLKKAREISPKTIRIMLTAHLDINEAMDLINEAGIYKFIQKPWDEEEIKSTIENGLEWQQMYSYVNFSHEG